MFRAENSGFCARVPLCLCGSAARRAMRTRAAPKTGKRRRVRHHRRAGGQKSRARPRGAGPNRQGAFLFWPTSPPPPRFLPPYRRRCRCGAAKGPPGPACARPAACPGARPAAGKAHTAKPPAPGAGAGGSSFVRPGPGCSVFRCARFCTKKQSPPCRLRQTKTYLFGRWVPCHGFHAPFFRNGGRSAIPPRTPGSR